MHLFETLWTLKLLLIYCSIWLVISQCEKIASILINSTMWAGFPVSCVGILLETCLSSEDIIKTHTKAANACKLFRSHLSRHKTGNVFFYFFILPHASDLRMLRDSLKKKDLQVHSYHTYKYGRDEDVIFIFHQTVALAMCLVMRHILCQNSLKSVVCVFRVSWYNMKQST